MKTILLVGAGRMGGALLRGWLNTLSNDFQSLAVDPHAAPHLADIPAVSETGVRFAHFNQVLDVPEDVDAAGIILATKPQLAQDALGGLRGQINPGTVVVSVAAGVSISTLQEVLPENQAVVRAMPNIGAVVGHSMSAAHPSAQTSEDQRQLVKLLFGAVGRFAWLANEEQLHAVTAISGSGPAYFFAMCEAMIEAGCKEGLERDVAEALVLGTISSSAHLLEQTPDPQHLRETVTSPNGTTAAGLEVLSEGNALKELAAQAIKAAKQRSQELS